MDPARIAELLQPFLVAEERVEAIEGAPGLAVFARPGRHNADQTVSLTQHQLQSISTYIDLLRRWNARINLTAIRDPEEIVTRHFGESFFAVRHLFPAERRSADREGHGFSRAEIAPLNPRALAPEVANDQRPRTNDLIDLGSGAGFPGLPIKLWAAHLRLTLVESNHKKATFLREVIRSLTLTDIDVFLGRAEDFPGQARVVTLRAVERFYSILPVAARLVVPSGRLALLIGQSQVGHACELLPSLRWLAPIPVPLSSSRVLLIADTQPTV